MVVVSIDQFEVRLGFEFQGMWVRKDHDDISCEAVSQTSRESRTEAGAIALIEHATAVFKRLQTSSAHFKSFTEGQTVRFCVIEDYGNGTAVIAKLVENKLVWS